MIQAMVQTCLSGACSNGSIEWHSIGAATSEVDMKAALFIVFQMAVTTLALMSLLLGGGKR